MTGCHEWDAHSGIRERFALLAALIDWAGRRGYPNPIGAAHARRGLFTYDPSRDRWDRKPDAPRSDMSGRESLECVVVNAEASVQLDRLRKLGVSYQDAMDLIGWGKEET